MRESHFSLTISSIISNHQNTGIHFENLSNSSTVVRNCTIARNESLDVGGINVIDGTVQILNNTIKSNQAAGASDGGGIHVEYGTVLIKDNTIYDNYAEYAGAGIDIARGQVIIQHNTLKANRSAGINTKGGAILASGGSVDIINNNISENLIIMGSDGAAIYYTAKGRISGNLITKNGTENSPNQGTSAVYINGEPIFRRNSIVENQTQYSFYCATSKNVPIIDAKYNYWGAVDETSIRKKIYDFLVDPSKALVDFSPWLQKEYWAVDKSQKKINMTWLQIKLSH